MRWMGPLRALLAVFALGIMSVLAYAETAAYPTLRESFDSALQVDVEQLVDQLGLTLSAERKWLALAVVDVTDPLNPRVAAVNGDHMLYAASLPKIAILLGAFVLIEEGDMALDDATRGTLTSMIRVSSNVAATQMLNRVGNAKLAAILQSDRYRLYDPEVNGGLWVGKPYGKSPAWKRDPLHNLSHGATALQVARFYYLLETNRLLPTPLSREVKAMLSEPAIQHKFVKGLSARPGAKIYRKSGTWRRWHSDSALVERDSYQYIIVGLTEHLEGGEWLSRLIGPIDDLIARAHPPVAVHAP